MLHEDGTKTFLFGMKTDNSTKIQISNVKTNTNTNANNHFGTEL